MTVFAMSHCLVCHDLFAYNPLRVPSLVVDGTREPVCRDCLELANRIRVSRGLKAFVAQPGAYDPMDESELWPVA